MMAVAANYDDGYCCCFLPESTLRMLLSVISMNHFTT